ncbi:RabGAP/TBC [Panus rudis PR-1116 ss-1]|nr:RabGAP/TBC [Panus rudis PR-1116 ss-1]
MEALSDDERNIVYLQGATPAPNAKPPNNFSLDDAFSDGDENDVAFDFSPAALREELSKSLPNSAQDWNADQDLNGYAVKIGYAVDADASVSTFDIDGSVHNEPISPPTQQSPSVASIIRPLPSHSDSLASEFSTITLSEHEHSSPPPESEEVQEQRDDTAASQPEGEDPPTGPPGIHIELHDGDSNPPIVREVRPSTPITVEHSERSSREIIPANGTPKSSNTPRTSVSNVSESSLPLPSSSSLPTPQSSSSNPSSSPPRHRPTKSLGPSILDKVVSKTRPHFLPPKPRTEDQKHLQDWERMMKQSRAAEEKRRKALQERRLARERRIEESIHIWEREIVPDWRVVHRNPALRKLWWQGIPTKLRATMWQNAVGNDLALSKDAFKTCSARANRALANKTFPTTVLGMIEDDISKTFPSLHLFIPERGPLYQDLKDMLCAWVVSRSDEGLGYVMGASRIAAMLLLYMAPAQGFLVMRNLLERHCMRSFYGGINMKDEVEAYYRIFDTLLADGMPKIYFNFKQHQVSPRDYFPEWILPLFLDHLPFEACARIWDVIMLEGDSFLYRASLAILAVLEPRLFFPDRKELLELLRGENKAALEVAKRDGRILDGGKYEIYGVDEETLWERIDAMDDWWKASTWTRLIQRELPDL